MVQLVQTFQKTPRAFPRRAPYSDGNETSSDGSCCLPMDNLIVIPQFRTHISLLNAEQTRQPRRIRVSCVSTSGLPRLLPQVPPSSMASTASADRVQRQQTERFRVLIIGNANAGKTTILEKVCNAEGHDPVFLDAAGNKVCSVLSKSREWVQYNYWFRSILN